MMTKIHNPDLSERAAELRKDATKEEKKLWFGFLRGQPFHFCRQKVIGNYIVDFYCAKYKLVIELDGTQHYESAGEEYDRKRDGYLASLGLTVLRYSNFDINTNFDSVCADIVSHIS